MLGQSNDELYEIAFTLIQFIKLYCIVNDLMFHIFFILCHRIFKTFSFFTGFNASIKFLIRHFASIVFLKKGVYTVS